MAADLAEQVRVFGYRFVELWYFLRDKGVRLWGKGVNRPLRGGNLPDGIWQLKSLIGDYFEEPECRLATGDLRRRQEKFAEKCDLLAAEIENILKNDS